MSIDLKLIRAGQCLAGGLLLQMALSFPLWLGPRSYPQIPIWGSPLPEALHFLPILLSALLALALLLILFNKQTSTTFALLLSSAILAIALDLTKCQSWFYFQILLLAILAQKNNRSPQQVLQFLRLLFPFLYFWGGLHKINGFYVEDTFLWFMNTFSWTQSLAGNQTLVVLSILLEISIAIGLWILHKKHFAIALGVLFHFGILLFLGPFGQNWNEVVWPWNIVMIALLFLIYYEKEGTSRQASFWSFSQTAIALKEWKPIFLPLLLLGFCPLLNAFQLWPDTLSFKLYTGDLSEGIFYTEENNIAAIETLDFPPFRCVLDQAQQQPNCYLIIDDWAFAEMGVAPFSTPRRLKQLARYYCSCLPYPEQSGLKILEVGWWKTEKPLQDFPCPELMK